MEAVVVAGPDEPCEYRTTAALHRKYLGSGIFPRLGPRFLAHYHATFAASPYGRALVARRDGHVVGFLVGTVSNAEHYRWVVRHRGPRLALRAGLALAWRPRVLWAFVSTRVGRYVGGARRLSRPRGDARQAGSIAAERDKIAVLTHVVTAAEVRGQGVGRLLVDKFLAEAGTAGSAQARLITPLAEPAADFYERLGWRSAGERQGRDGRHVREYRLDLREGDRP